MSMRGSRSRTRTSMRWKRATRGMRTSMGSGLKNRWGLNLREFTIPLSLLKKNEYDFHTRFFCSFQIKAGILIGRRKHFLKWAGNLTTLIIFLKFYHIANLSTSIEQRQSEKCIWTLLWGGKVDGKYGLLAVRFDIVVGLYLSKFTCFWVIQTSTVFFS